MSFSQTGELSGCVRGTVSLCSIYRDDPERNQVHLNVRSTFDAGELALRPLIVRAVADMFVSACSLVECAHRRKLA